MPRNMTQPNAFQNDPGHIKKALDSRLSEFDFEQGALLVQVPQFPLHMVDAETARGRGYFAYPPQNILYLAAIFRSLGVETELLDLNYTVLRQAVIDDGVLDAAWKQALDETLKNFASSLICISLMFDSTYPSFKKVLDYVRKKKPGVCIAAGGVAATADPEKLLGDGVDLVFSHEGEYSLEKFYAYLRRATDEIPPNLSFLDDENRTLQTQSMAGSIVDLDIRPEYARIPIARYNEVGSLSNFSRMNGLDIPFATVVSRRGCRARCSFCGVRNFNGKGVRVRQTDGVIDEMVHLYTEYGIRHFDWLDDDLLYDRDAIIELIYRIAGEMPDITWAANNGLIASAITPEILDAMETSNCIGYKIGLESGNEKVLKDIHKPTNLPKFFEFTELAKNYPSMFAAVNFIIGFPENTVAEILDSFKAALHGGLDWNNFYMYQHLKNTELYIAYGSMGGGDVEDKAQTNSQPMSSLNPVRGGLFKEEGSSKPPLSGYDILDYEPARVPNRDQLKEIWFTLNFVVNFLRMPALYTKHEKRLKNGIQWMEALSRSYPNDPSMIALLYSLHKRLGELPSAELDRLRDTANANFEKSEYWQRRNREFSISAFLDGHIPEADSRILPFLRADASNVN